ncbi:MULTISPECIES: hypothetical protein [Pseudomonas]|uniref:hypothetical protein n=1 Tax=Pseudomonas TaxID=286 RepID=UPI001F2CC8A2|nr:MULTISPECIES: hypothetical protein [Pseudomonas]MDW3711709.1 hypothetical protein [Pseudomonas sp. 2023EL-01195]
MLTVTGPLRLLLLLALAFAALSQPAYAGNTPCSGSKGGIARCDGDLFLCNDGSISGSKRSCSSYLGSSRSTPNQVSPSLRRFADSSSECACGTSTFCTGPRGGVYCMTPGGRKSYVRK